MTSPYLSDAEVLDICRPLTQPAAMVRRLKNMGFHVKPRPNGWPLVSRANFDAVMRGATQMPVANDTPGSGPDVQALLDRFKKKEPSYGNGEKEKIQPARAT